VCIAVKYPFTHAGITRAAFYHGGGASLESEVWDYLQTQSATIDLISSSGDYRPSFR
jgi:hypothetical protein